MKLDSSLPKTLVKAALAFDKKYPGMIEAIETGVHDGDAKYWLYSSKGYCTDPECHTASSDTIALTISDMSRIKHCNCLDCQK